MNMQIEELVRQLPTVKPSEFLLLFWRQNALRDSTVCTSFDQAAEPLVLRVLCHAALEEVPEPQESERRELPAGAPDVDMSVPRSPLLRVNVEEAVEVQAQALELGQAGSHQLPWR